ncbi:MAG: hypothetical protein WCF24_01790 [Acidimicrobiales bacterium]
MSTPALFSDAWFMQISAALSKVEPDADWPRLDLGIAIDDAPGGPIRYTFHLGPDGAALEVGSLDSAVVTLVESFDTARAIDEGRAVSDLLAEGRITVRGDATALVAAQRSLATISTILGQVADTAQS